MRATKYLFTAFIFTFFFACSSDEPETDNENGTLREITENQDSTSAQASEEDDSASPAFAAEIKAGSDFYAHLEVPEKQTIIELSAFENEVFLMLSSRRYDEAVSLNGTFDDNGEFTVKGITQANGEQLEYRGRVIDGREIELKPISGNEETLRARQNYTGSLAFEAYSFSEEVDSETGNFSDKMQLLFPAEKQKCPDFYQAVSRLIFDKSGDSPRELMKQHHQGMLNEFRQNARGGFWNREIQTEILYNTKGYLAYGLHEFSYTGGAHGAGAGLFLVYDINACRSVKLSDMFGESDLKKLEKRIYEQIKRSREMSDSEMQSEYDLPVKPNNNFYFTPKGLHFVYNAYEITNYAMGPDAVFISFEELKQDFETNFFDDLAL